MEDLLKETAQMIRERVSCGCLMVPNYVQCSRCKLLERVNEAVGE